MPLNQSKSQQAKFWLDSKGVSLDCKVCGVGKIELIGELLGLLQADYADSSMTSTVAVLDAHIPVIWCRCQNCGHILFFDATSLGVGIASNK